MAKNAVTDWDENPNLNTDIGGTNIDEGCAPSGMNNAVRATMGQISQLEGDDTIASSATTNLSTVPGRYVSVTGTATITALGTVKAGTIKFLRFAGALTLTYNATSLILPSAANIVTVAGDVAVVVSEGSGNWRCLLYQRATGAAIVANYAGKNDSQRNRIVNGDMRISQENGTTSGTTTGFYPVDQWAQFRVTSAGTLTVAQVASVTPAGSPNRLRATVTVADATLAAGEYWSLNQNLEGSNVADFQYGGAAAKAGVLRFGFKGPAGTYAASLKNYNGGTPNRSFVALFTITAPQANTDTVQEIAITGDVTGTWLTADGVIGMALDIVLACGSTFQGAAGWQAGNILGTSTVTNGMATGGSVFELFDVGFRLDPDATGVYGTYRVAEVDAVFRSERYVQDKTLSLQGPTTGALAVSYYFTTPMAKTPTRVNITTGSPSGATVNDDFANPSALGAEFRIGLTAGGGNVFGRLNRYFARLS